MRWGWLFLVIVVALVAAYAFGLAPAALMKRLAEDERFEAELATPPSARPDFGEPPPKPPAKP